MCPPNGEQNLIALLYDGLMSSMVCPLLCVVSQTFFLKPPGGLYSLPYLAEGLQADGAILCRAEWWELLFFIKKLEPKQQQEVNNILCQSLDDQARAVTSSLAFIAF